MMKSSLKVASHSSKFVYVGLMMAAIMVLLVLSDYPVYGQIAIGIYALLAFWRQESRQVFKLAMVALAVSMGALAVGRLQVADTFAGYVFLLLLVGVFVLGRELWYFSKALRLERSTKEVSAK